MTCISHTCVTDFSTRKLHTELVQRYMFQLKVLSHVYLQHKKQRRMHPINQTYLSSLSRLQSWRHQIRREVVCLIGGIILTLM